MICPWVIKHKNANMPSCSSAPICIHPKTVLSLHKPSHYVLDSMRVSVVNVKRALKNVLAAKTRRCEKSSTIKASPCCRRYSFCVRPRAMPYIGLMDARKGNNYCQQWLVALVIREGERETQRDRERESQRNRERMNKWQHDSITWYNIMFTVTVYYVDHMWGGEGGREGVSRH